MYDGMTLICMFCDPCRYFCCGFVCCWSVRRVSSTSGYQLDGLPISLCGDSDRLEKRDAKMTNPRPLGPVLAGPAGLPWLEGSVVGVAVGQVETAVRIERREAAGAWSCRQQWQRSKHMQLSSISAKRGFAHHLGLFSMRSIQWRNSLGLPGAQRCLQQRQP